MINNGSELSLPTVTELQGIIQLTARYYPNLTISESPLAEQNNRNKLGEFYLI